MIITFSWFITITLYIYMIYGFFFDIEILILIIKFLWYHIYIGFQVILNDYFHIQYIKNLLLLFLRIFILEISRHFFEFFL
uniref:Succinate:cytochrome c oxidoreductase subunit 4 n=1 Tax=Plocamium cartilagineum TaxID=31452 RepID=A0A0E3DBS1_PLOCA|nr:succinate:cytochrome c oxidoreductase subunit 4 [Plocamium cartilagineum]